MPFMVRYVIYMRTQNMLRIALNNTGYIIEWIKLNIDSISFRVNIA